MAKGAKVTYSDAERFGAEFKERRNEINNEISISFQSEEFRSRIREIVYTWLSNHDEVANLSRRFFENVIFIDKFKQLVKHEIESNRQTTWIKFFTKVI